MCGLVGAFGSIILSDKEAFSDLLYLNRFRGKHSTGIASISLPTNHQKEEVKIIKSVGSFLSLVSHQPQEFMNEVIKGWPNVLIGHGRHATQGKIDTESAHPFEFSDIIGVHNGTVFQNSLKDFYEADKYTIDSQMIFSQINHDPDVQKVWDKADGALALVWWDKVSKNLHIVRNKDRTLFYTMNKTGNTLFWASEEWMLEIALSRHRISYNKIYPVDINKHYIFNYGNFKVTMDTHLLKPFVPVKTVYRQDDKNYADWWKKTMRWEDAEYYDVAPASSSTTTGTNVVALPEKNTSTGSNASSEKNDDFLYFKILSYENGIFWGETEEDVIRDIVITLPDDNINSLKKLKETEFKRVMSGKTNTIWKVQNKNVKITNTHGYDFVETSSVCVYNTYTVTKEKEELALGFNDTKLSKYQFENITKNECSNCFNKIGFNKRHEIKWLSEDEAVCKHCQGLPIIQEAFATIANRKMN